jgi:hypothetical protein
MRVEDGVVECNFFIGMIGLRHIRQDIRSMGGPEKSMSDTSACS